MGGTGDFGAGEVWDVRGVDERSGCLLVDV